MLGAQFVHGAVFLLSGSAGVLLAQQPVGLFTSAMPNHLHEPVHKGHGMVLQGALQCLTHNHQVHKGRGWR